MMVLKNLKWWHVFIGILVICGVPVLLNYTLQISTNTKVLGDEVTWLNFWAVYIGSILTGLMVVASYITIDKTINLSISQRKLEWLNEFRRISSSLLIDASPNTLGILLQQMPFESGISNIMNKSMDIRHKLEKDIYELENLFKGYEELFKDSQSTFDKYVKDINALIKPFLDVLDELAQYTIIYSFLENKSIYSQTLEHVKKMQESMAAKGFLAIVQMIEDLKRYDDFQQVSDEEDFVIKMTVSQALTHKMSLWSYIGFKQYLLNITKTESPKIHGKAFIFISHTENDSSNANKEAK